MISLSNLVKQQYVTSFGGEKRIINADGRYRAPEAPKEEGSAFLFPNFDGDAPGSEEILDGFLAGLAVEEVHVEPQISPEELLAQAAEEAEGILAAARAEAMQIAEDARAEAEILLLRTKEEAYADAIKQATEELEAKERELEEEYSLKNRELQKTHEERMETMESDVLEAVLKVVEHVFAVSFEDKKEILLHLVNGTLLDIEPGKEIRLRVSTADYEYMHEHVSDLKEKLGNDISIEVISDSGLEEGDCMIDTASGIFDCGIHTQLENIERDIRTLCI